VVGIAVGYGAVAGEREAGTVRTVLGTAGTRRDFVIGKLIARFGVVSLALAPTVLLAEAIAVVHFGDPFPGVFLAWAGSVLIVGLVWTAFVVGVSAAVPSRYRTIAAVFGTYLVFSRSVGLWNPIVRPLFSFVFTGQFGTYQEFLNAANPAPWFVYTDHLNPFVALQTVEDALFVLTGNGTEFTDAPVPLLLSSSVVCLSFAVVPAYLGCRRFERTDLK